MKLITALYDIFTVISTAVVIAIPLLCLTIFSIDIPKESINIFDDNIFLEVTTAASNSYYAKIDTNLLVVIASSVLLVTVILGIIHSNIDNNKSSIRPNDIKVFTVTMDILLIIFVGTLVIASIILSSDYKEILSETVLLSTLINNSESTVRDFMTNSLLYNNINMSIRDAFLIELFILVSLRILIHYNKEVFFGNKTIEKSNVDSLKGAYELSESFKVGKVSLIKETAVVSDITDVDNITEITDITDITESTEINDTTEISEIANSKSEEINNEIN